MEQVAEIPNSPDYATAIYNLSGCRFDPHIAQSMWPQILKHKWFLSEKLGRDVGMRVACFDYMENVEKLGLDADDEQLSVLMKLGAQRVEKSIWDTISETQPPKQMVSKRIILPLTEAELAEKHGVQPPRTIIFFGPPGTGKTHFVRAIAGVLGWWYVEVSPGLLLEDGEERLSSNLKRLMERVRVLDEAVIFIDEFEEIAGTRDNASRIDKSITNEFLKQVPLFKREDRRTLLICATNYIRHLDAALLRPGRFDCIIPVGGLDDQGRRTIVEHYLKETNIGAVDLDAVVGMMPFFTPADIEFLFQKVRQTAFEREYVQGEEFRVTTDVFREMIPQVRYSLTPEIIAEFEEDCRRYTRS